MVKKRLLLLAGSICLIIVLAALPFLGACSSQTVTTPPKGAVTSSSAIHGPVALEIYSNPFGKAGYVLSFALADIINKKSAWLRAVTIETPSGVANLGILQRSPEKSGVWVGFCNPLSIAYSTKGGAPFTPEKPFNMNIKALSLAVNIGEQFVTTDPKIKTPQDLIGKKVGFDVIGNTGEFVPRALLDVWGVLDKVKIVTMGVQAQSDGLIDGTIDLGRFGSTMLGHDEFSDWDPIAPFAALCASKPVYNFPDTVEGLTKAREKSGYPLYPISGKGKTVGKATFPNWTGLRVSNGWFVSADMPDDVVTEITRIIYENAELFVTYHSNGAGITKETIGEIAVPKANYHPATIKYLEAKGMKVGMAAQ